MNDLIATSIKTEEPNSEPVGKPGRRGQNLSPMRALLWLHGQRFQARVKLAAARCLIPRRALATVTAAFFLTLYLVNGVLIVWNRPPASADDLRHWLGGAIAVYACFQWIRAVWQEPGPRLGLSPSEQHWLGLAPLADWQLVAYRFMAVIFPCVLKTLMIAVVMMRDVVSIPRLLWALLLSLLVMEALRLSADALGSALAGTRRKLYRAAFAMIAVLLLVQLAARTVNHAQGSSHPLALLLAFSHAMGDTASTPIIQTLALPWAPLCQLALAEEVDLRLLASIIACHLVLALAVGLAIVSDRWSRVQMIAHEQHLYSALRVNPVVERHGLTERVLARGIVQLPNCFGIGPLMARQWETVRRYRFTIVLSLAVPALLSLSPLLNDTTASIFHVAAWLAVCTLMLAPPALKIDFRRDLQRLALLKSLPVTPWAMTLGQVLLPVLITILFQILVLAVASLLIAPAPTAFVLAVGCLSSLAVISFALENALFLTFPHGMHQEGLAMMIRTKLVFLGKGLLLLFIGAAFIAYFVTGHRYRLPMQPLVAGCIGISWLFALTSLWFTSRCWNRFDTRLDTPPSA